MTYAFEAATRSHIAEVAARLETVCQELRRRAAVHDASKFSDAERLIYAEVWPKLKGLIYGTPGYERAVGELGAALEHHQENNSHHPEHYQNGVGGMDLIDVVEMYCDWAAASLGSDMERSLMINADRYAIEGPLRDILWNTWQRFGGFRGGPATNLPDEEDSSATAPN